MKRFRAVVGCLVVMLILFAPSIGRTTCLDQSTWFIELHSAPYNLYLYALLHVEEDGDAYVSFLNGGFCYAGTIEGVSCEGNRVVATRLDFLSSLGVYFFSFAASGRYGLGGEGVFYYPYFEQFFPVSIKGALRLGIHLPCLE